MNNNRTTALVTCAMLSAVICVISLIAIPMPVGVPLTFQCFAVALCGYFAGSAKGAVSVIIYLLIGLIGLPVFAGMRGGFQAFVSPTGGYLAGFVPLCLMCGGYGIYIKLSRFKTITAIAFGIFGTVLCHLCGVIVFSVISGTDFISSLCFASLPYILKDIALVIGAYFTSLILTKKLNINKA